MRKITKIILLAIALFTVLEQEVIFAQRGSAQADFLEVRIASPLPRESPWGRTLDRIAAEWARVTNNQVRMRALHGGTEGNEARMHLSLSSNAIQAAVFTSIGLNAINPSVMTMSTPFLIRTEQELNEVMRVVQGDLENRLNSGDYFIVAWSKSGFVNIFSRDPVLTPDDLRRQQIASSLETAEMNTIFRTMGFRVVEADMTDMGPRLATGQVMAMYQNPAAVAAFQLHNQMRNMFSMNIAPVLGGIVINQVTWRRIGAMNPRYQQELVRVTRQIAEELDRTMARTVNDAVLSMRRDGLRVNEPNPNQQQLWFSEIERAIPSLLGTATFDRELYQRINDVLISFRGR